MQTFHITNLIVSVYEHTLYILYSFIDYVTYWVIHTHFIYVHDSSVEHVLHVNWNVRSGFGKCCILVKFCFDYHYKHQVNWASSRGDETAAVIFLIFMSCTSNGMAVM